MKKLLEIFSKLCANNYDVLDKNDQLFEIFLKTQTKEVDTFKHV